MKTLSGLGLRIIVIHQVSDAADGLWLYARLMLDEVQKTAQCSIRPTPPAESSSRTDLALQSDTSEQRVHIH